MRPLCVLLLTGCSWSFSSATPPCPANGALAGADIVLGSGAAVTGAVAAYPCVGDVDQRDSIRVLHCGVMVAGAAVGALYYYSARAGLRDRRQCQKASDVEEKTTRTDPIPDRRKVRL